MTDDDERPGEDPTDAEEHGVDEHGDRAGDADGGATGGAPDPDDGGDHSGASAPRDEDDDESGDDVRDLRDETDDLREETDDLEDETERLREELRDLRDDLDDFEDDVQSRTVERPRLEAELKHYVRKRMRQGHARGWGPYLVLLYGTVMTLGAFFWLGGWASVAAMLVIFTSTLGLYVLFVLFGGLWGAVGAAAGLVDSVRRGR